MGRGGKEKGKEERDEKWFSLSRRKETGSLKSVKCGEVNEGSYSVP